LFHINADGRWPGLIVDDGLAGNMVHALLVTPDGMLWVATNGELSRFDPTGWMIR